MFAAINLSGIKSAPNNGTAAALLCAVLCGVHQQPIIKREQHGLYYRMANAAYEMADLRRTHWSLGQEMMQ